MQRGIYWRSEYMRTRNLRDDHTACFIRTQALHKCQCISWGRQAGKEDTPDGFYWGE